MPALLVFAPLCFSAAFLVFIIQPMLAKVLVPIFGGAPPVWSSCLVFFQCCVLFGYLYSYILGRCPVRRQPVIHFLILSLSLWLMPSFADFSLAPPSIYQGDFKGMGPFFLIFLSLLPLALPLLLLSSTTSLLAGWLTLKEGPGSKPFLLFAVANGACLFALGGYLFWLEPYMLLRDQLSAWWWGYPLHVLALMLVCLWRGAYFRQKKAPSERQNFTPSQLPAGLILVEAALPCALLASLSSYLATWTASLPIVWLLPLGIYLFSMMLAFSGRFRGQWLLRVWPMAATVAVLVYILGHRVPALWALSVHVVAFSLVALGLHMQLYRVRPTGASQGDLSYYYLLIAAGGAIGSLFASLLAPMVFSSFFEVPLCYVLCRLVFRSPQFGPSKVSHQLPYRGAFLFLFAGLCYFFLDRNKDTLTLTIQKESLYLLAPLILAMLFRRPKTILLAATIYAVLFTHTLWQKNLLHHERSFFASLMVKKSASGRFHSLVHGDIVHGRQDRHNPQRPMSYYHEGSGLGLVFARFSSSIKSVGAVGMGVGTVSSYLHSGDKIDYFEIDPLVVEMAQDEGLFSYLSDSEKRGVKTFIHQGDGRALLSLSKKKFDLLVVDAFSSSAIPVHLLTREALDLYMSRLEKGGLLLIHISNPSFDIESVLSAYQSERRKGFVLKTGGDKLGSDPATWVVFSASYDEGSFGWFSRRWRPLKEDNSFLVWTDQRSWLPEIISF